MKRQNKNKNQNQNQKLKDKYVHKTLLRKLKTVQHERNTNKAFMMSELKER